MSRHTPWGLRGIAAIAVAGLVAAGCGGGGSGTPGAGATSGAAVTAVPGAGGAGAQSVTNYVSYTGGKAGKADPSLPPVYIGWVNQQGGQQVIGALATNGAQLAVKYINAELGGVDGHPVALKTCFIASAEEEGTTCGQRLAADKQVSVIDEGGVAIGVQSLYSTIGGAKPVIAGVAATPIDSVQKNSAILFGDVTHVLGPFGTYAKDVLHAKTAALIYPNTAGIIEGAKAISDSLQRAGVKVKKVGYSPSQTDLIGPLTSAGAQTADMVIPYSDASGCVNLAKGLKQLGINDAKKIVSAPLCLNSQVLEGLGGDFPIWTYSIASSLFGDKTDPGVPAYLKVVQTYGAAKDAPDPWNIVAFSQVLTTVRFLNEIGYDHITPQAVLEKAKAFTGPVALGAPELKCGKYNGAPGVCNDRVQFFQYAGKQQFVKVAGWLTPPA
ncbi:MAG TPA: ABC transporter substrate-binding protein [Streptosporangiaceae bacterium]